MNVHKLKIDSPRLFIKNKKYEPIFGARLTEYYKSKNYGESVNEVLYMEILVPDELEPDPSIKKVVYVQDAKKIMCIIQPDYTTAIRTGMKKYGHLLSKCYLEMSEEFSSLSIKDFDVLKFNEDLSEFFTLNKLA